MSAAYYDIETQECSHFHLDDGNGVHPSHSRKYKFIYGTEGTIRGTPKTILQTRSYEFPASFSKSVTNFATSCEGRGTYQ